MDQASIGLEACLVIIKDCHMWIEKGTTSCHVIFDVVFVSSNEEAGTLWELTKYEDDSRVFSHFKSRT